MDRVARYYDESVQYEWDRLERHRTEFAVTMRALREHLPPAPAAVLDIGSGPGRYALALARLGYAVTQLDLSANSLAFARAKAEEAGVRFAGSFEGTAADLGRFGDASFDVVLLMGPLYHLLHEDERDLAVREARRVLKPDGLVFAAFVTRYAAIRDAARRRPGEILASLARWERTLATGVLEVPDGGDFTDAYFAHPAEVCPFLERHGFECLDLHAAEGVICMIEDGVNQLTGDVWEAWVDLNYRLGRDPSVHGAATHLLYVGRKRS